MIEYLQIFLPIVTFILLIILLIVGIILGVRLIGAMDKLDNILNNVEGKVNSLNGLFNVIDFATDKMSIFTDRIVEVFANFIGNIGKKKASKRIREEEENE